jgi:hypothetical protein
MLSQSVANYPMLLNNPKERRSQLHCGRNLKSLTLHILVHVSHTTSTHVQGHYIKCSQSLIISHQVTHMIHHALSPAYSYAAYWRHCEVCILTQFLSCTIVIRFSATGYVSDSKAVSCMPASSRHMHAGNSLHPHICADMYLN